MVMLLPISQQPSVSVASNASTFLLLTHPLTLIHSLRPSLNHPLPPPSPGDLLRVALDYSNDIVEISSTHIRKLLEPYHEPPPAIHNNYSTSPSTGVISGGGGGKLSQNKNKTLVDKRSADKSHTEKHVIDATTTTATAAAVVAVNKHMLVPGCRVECIVEDNRGFAAQTRAR